MKLPILLALLLLSLHGLSQSRDEQEIRKLMSDQTLAWNRGSLDDFMKGYWNNDSLMFIGKTGISYGYNTALNNYKKSYSNKDLMGQLFFTLLSLKKISADSYFIVGKWFLKRKTGDIGGIYSLLFRKIGGKWVIVADHTQ